MQFKFIGEIYFDASDMDDALLKLADHFTRLAKGEVSHITQVGSSTALGPPELDPQLNRLIIVEKDA